MVASVTEILGFMPTNRSPRTIFMLLGYDAFDVMLNRPSGDTVFRSLGKRVMFVSPVIERKRTVQP